MDGGSFPSTKVPLSPGLNFYKFSFLPPQFFSLKLHYVFRAGKTDKSKNSVTSRNPRLRFALFISIIRTSNSTPKYLLPSKNVRRVHPPHIPSPLNHPLFAPPTNPKGTSNTPLTHFVERQCHQITIMLINL